MGIGGMHGFSFSTVNVYLDIENTIIDDLAHGNFLEENCKRISKLVHSIAFPVKVHLYTWGWIKPDDVSQEVVDKIFRKLEINAFNRGTVYTKSYSVKSAIKRGVLHGGAYETALVPGMMKTFHLDKIGCFYGDFSVYDSNHAILIDDLVEKTEANPYECVSLVNPTDIPETFDELLDKKQPIKKRSPFLPPTKKGSPFMTEERAREVELKKIAIDGRYLEAFRYINKLINGLRFVVTTVSGDKAITDMSAFSSSDMTPDEIPIYERVWNITFGDPTNAIRLFKTSYTEDGSQRPVFTNETKDTIKGMILDDIERNPIEWSTSKKLYPIAQHYLNGNIKEVMDAVCPGGQGATKIL